MQRSHKRSGGALVAIVALVFALLPATAASAGHFGAIDLSLDIRDPGTTADDSDNEIVSDQAEFEVTASPTDGDLPDTTFGLDLPSGFTYASATSDNGVECRQNDHGRPEVLCDVGSLTGSTTATITADTTGRTASTVTGTAYATWDNVPAVFANDTVVLADTTLNVEPMDTEDNETVSFTVANSGAATDGAPTAEDVTVEIRLPEPDADAAATYNGTECDRPDEAESTPDGNTEAGDNANIICQNIQLEPSAGSALDSVLGQNATQITVENLDGSEAIRAEAKGDNTTRAAIGFNTDGSVVSQEEHDPQSRNASAAPNRRRGVQSLGVLLNTSSISLPAEQFTPIFGQVRYDLTDADNAGDISVDWVEGGTRYEFQATDFRNLKPEADYFQDGGINFDTHQHGAPDDVVGSGATFRPTGPDNVPDLFSQWLVYSEGTLTVTQADGQDRTFQNVGMHAMYRQAALPEEGVEAFQRWAEKGGVIPRTATINYGAGPDVPVNLNLVDVLFANTPNGDGCAFNGVAGDTCNEELGTFVRLMTFARGRFVQGFNPAGIDLLAANPYETVTDRFDSIDQAVVATTDTAPEDADTSVAVGLDASAKRFASAQTAGDTRTQADYVVLSRADKFPDSLAGSGLAGGVAPILFTPGGPDGTLDPRVRAEIRRVLGDSGKVYLLGETEALPSSVQAALIEDGHEVERLGGADRIDTAKEVAAEVRELTPDADEQLLARAFPRGEDASAAWADSIAGGAYAAAQRIPVVLTYQDRLDEQAAEALSSGSTTFLLGGLEALNEQVESSAEDESASVERIAGETRVDTAIEISKQLFGRTSGSDGDQFVASPGYDQLGWAYGLAAAPFAAQENAPVLLLHPADAIEQTITPEVTDYLESLDYSKDTEGNVTVSSNEITDYQAVEILELLVGNSD